VTCSLFVVDMSAVSREDFSLLPHLTQCLADELVSCQRLLKPDFPGGCHYYIFLYWVVSLFRNLFLPSGHFFLPNRAPNLLLLRLSKARYILVILYSKKHASCCVLSIQIDTIIDVIHAYICIHYFLSSLLTLSDLQR